MPQHRRMPRSTVTQQDVADRAGVTRATVSYVLSGRAAALRISADVTARVRAAAQALGYVPNNAARALASGKTQTLGLLIASAARGLVPFWSRIAEGVESQALAGGYNVLLMSHHSLRLPAPGELQRLCHGRIDALISLGVTWHDDDDALQGMLWPVVAVQPYGPRAIPTVALDAAPGITAAVQHLAQLGHRHIAWIGPPQNIAHGRDTLVQAAATACRIACDLYYVSSPELPLSEPADRIIAQWRTHLEPLLPGLRKTSALMCWNDRMALGLYSLLSTCGLRVPHDVSVIGFDDWEAGMALPPLSTISHEFHALGQAATSLALRMIGTPPHARGGLEQHLLVPAQFVPRASTGAAPQ